MNMASGPATTPSGRGTAFFFAESSGKMAQGEEAGRFGDVLYLHLGIQGHQALRILDPQTGNPVPESHAVDPVDMF